MNSAQAQFCRLMHMRNIIYTPAHFGYDMQDFNGDFPDFTKDFRISTEIMKDFRDFNRDIRILRNIFKFSREISGKVYKILVSERR